MDQESTPPGKESKRSKIARKLIPSRGKSSPGGTAQKALLQRRSVDPTRLAALQARESQRNLGVGASKVICSCSSTGSS